MKRLSIFLAACFSLGCVSDKKTTVESTLEISTLTCEYLENPSVVDVPNPRLSWINIAPDGVRNQKQAAFHVRVASSEEGLEKPDLWDSEQRMSDQSTRVLYEGKELESMQECWWQVRIWDQDGNVSGWSDPGWWRMGLLKDEDWVAQWIGAPWEGEKALPKPDGGPRGRPVHFGPPAPLLRKEFSVKKEVKSAVVYVTGLGYFELYMNGGKVGDDVLVPNQTNYGKRPQLTEALIWLPDDFREYKVMYMAYDVKDQLIEGSNVMGGILGNGFYNPAKFWAASYGSPRFLCQLYITYNDGSEEVIVTDESWKASKSPIMMNMVYYGEHYDARKEQPGWSTAEFEDEGWENVVIRKAPFGKLVAHTAHPDKVTEELTPVSIKKLEEGRYFVDFGVEISGWVRLNGVEGPAGHKIEMKFNGNLYSGDNSYIFRGKGPESYAPRFNWFVFSGVEISNWPGKLESHHVTAEAVNTYIQTSATFETSNQLFNDINKIWRRSQLDNMHGGVASDCPHRERSPYTGDGQITCITVLHNYDAKNFYQKWVQDMLGAQIEETGYVPNGAPWQPGCGGGPAWGAAICVIPWEYYVQYGSLDMVQDNYEGMKGYVRYMQTWVDDDGIMHSKRTAKDGSILKWFNLGEWVPPGELMQEELAHTFYLWYCSTITARTARIMGLDSEAGEYEELANTTRLAFYRRFYNEEKGSYGNAGGNILALKMGVPDDQYGRVVSALRAGLIASKGHLDTGILGTRFFFEILAENGMHEEAYVAMNKRTEPGFGHWLELGSTTTRERWDTGGSYNHPMFGGGLVWFYRNLAGMRADPDNPGYKHIIFRPQTLDQLDHVTYTNQTPYGDCGISWSQDELGFAMDIEIPVSCYATVFVPSSNRSQVHEGGEPINNKEVSFLRQEDGYSVFEVGSGNYAFQVPYTQ